MFERFRQFNNDWVRWNDTPVGKRFGMLTMTLVPVIWASVQLAEAIKSGKALPGPTELPPGATFIQF